MDIQGIIFDFDGTLAELNLDFGLMARRVEELARGEGFSGPWPEGYLLEALTVVSERMGDGFAGRAELVIEAVELEAAGRGRLFPFTRPLLAQGRAQGLSLGVVSRNCGAAIRHLLPEADQLHAFLPRERAPKPKPHPDQLWDACREMGLDPGRAAMVGDHPTDMQAAVAAGCLAVGVTSGRVGGEELKEAGATVVLPDAGGILGLLQGKPVVLDG
ncbi:MAG: HAD family hydrolase [Desulfarculaceae bacterium]|nr:HAD family hydrolase [Desulfarculaceae bacterium]MCF8048968.1 HAD family hydrolase [Desulfarculaceae bacterium]MCF8065249.1 HAD family hydrolase [Desulfarculaceae bacterium]MCF8099061.1 HAD family hydrolase [Desulfarculaceae bacterium]MCF8123454.1 HAD family hydrolase [Desulfarculaceae bacterium]